MILMKMYFRNLKPIQMCDRSRRMYSATAGETSKPGNSTTSTPGLSSKVVVVSTGEVGPGASKVGQYKNAEYFCYHRTSYFDAELEMLKFRLPQPSSVDTS